MSNSIPGNEENNSGFDIRSAKRQFGWVQVGFQYLPCIYRNLDSFFAERIFSPLISIPMANAFLYTIPNFKLIDSYLMTQNEIDLFNEINSEHCDNAYGEIFTSFDLLMRVEDCLKIYDVITSWKNGWGIRENNFYEDTDMMHMWANLPHGDCAPTIVLGKIYSIEDYINLSNAGNFGGANVPGDLDLRNSNSKFNIVDNPGEMSSMLHSSASFALNDNGSKVNLFENSEDVSNVEHPDAAAIPGAATAIPGDLAIIAEINVIEYLCTAADIPFVSASSNIIENNNAMENLTNLVYPGTTSAIPVDLATVNQIAKIDILEYLCTADDIPVISASSNIIEDINVPENLVNISNINYFGAESTIPVDLDIINQIGANFVEYLYTDAEISVISASSNDIEGINVMENTVIISNADYSGAATTIPADLATSLNIGETNAMEDPDVILISSDESDESDESDDDCSLLK